MGHCDGIADIASASSESTGNRFYQSVNISFKINFGKVVGLIKNLINKTHGAYAVITFRKGLQRNFISDFFRLQIQQTDNNLEIVIYTMMNFP